MQMCLATAGQPEPVTAYDAGACCCTGEQFLAAPIICLPAAAALGLQVVGAALHMILLHVVS